MNKSRPLNWKKTLSDLMEEMEKRIRFPEPHEFEWARDYERSLLPPETIFPKGGQVWEAVRSCDVLVQLWFTAPASGSAKGRLTKGERVRISAHVEGEPIVVSFLPVRYGELHHRLVPARVRSEPLYGSYTLSMSTKSFNKHFKLVEKSAPQKPAKLDAVMAAFQGKNATTKKRYNRIFNIGFKAGARGRVAAGITDPTGFPPDRSAKIPKQFASREEKTLWAAGYRMGYAIGTPLRRARRKLS